MPPPRFLGYNLPESSIFRSSTTAHPFFELPHAAIGKGFSQTQMRHAGAVRPVCDVVRGFSAWAAPN